MTDKKPNQSTMIIILAALLVLGAGYYFFAPKSAGDTVGHIQSEEVILPEETQSDSTIESGEAAATIESAPVQIDVARALSERILGNPSAPIKISEHASFTCSHCAHFHAETFSKLKAAYIDTGKAYLVFSDFPLNGPALHASMIARCMPEDKYFDFVHELFAKQEEWAFEADALSRLKQEAEKFGMPGEEFKACIENKDLQQGVVDRMSAAQKQWNITSTPSFVINNKTVIGGAMDFETFEKALNDALTAPEGESPASPEAPENETGAQ